MTHWGAAPEDWAHFDLNLGLTEDLLPVVSDPAAEISDRSNMKALGKTPSHFNGQGKAVGIPDWTSRIARPAEIDRWMKDGRLGICVQTRRVRALDIDVDHPSANAIADLFALIAFDAFSRRFRANSGKQLLAFILEGEYPKRSFKTTHGLVEFLGNGQQFVAVGTHTSGERYQWENGLPESLPLLTAEQFEKAWAAIVERFALPDTAYEAGTRKRGEDFHAVDPVAEHLIDAGLVLAEGRDGQLFVECPWKDGHSSDSGVTETAWFPAGTNGYERGHLRCLHASCDKRSDDDFTEALGIGTSSDFAEIVEPDVHLPTTSPNGLRRDKAGRIEASVRSVVLAFSTPGWFGVEFAHDTFLGATVFRRVGDKDWRPVSDDDVTMLRCNLEDKGFKPVALAEARAAVHAVGWLNRFDSAQTWLASLTWDGVPRVERFLPTYLGAADTAYTRAVGLYWWTALAGRILDPGCQADMVPAMIGYQGAGKTSLLRALVPARSQYSTFDLGKIDNDDTARRMRGVLIGELGELRGLRSSSQENIKDWITRRDEKWTLKFRESEYHFPRRLLLVASGNKDQFLADPTGERRWLPFRVGTVDRAAIHRDREQLWAEGQALYLERLAQERKVNAEEPTGVMWKAASDLAQAEHDAFKMPSFKLETVEEWLEKPDSVTGETPTAKGFVRSVDILTGAFGRDFGKIEKKDEHEIGEIMTALGFKHDKKRVDGRSVWVWLVKNSKFA